MGKKLFLLILPFVFCAGNFAWAEGISEARGVKAKPSSSVGLEALRGVQVGLAVGSRKISTDCQALWGCQGNQTGTSCRCFNYNHCVCNPVYHFGSRRIRASMKHSYSGCNYSCFQDTTSSYRFAFKH